MNIIEKKALTRKITSAVNGYTKARNGLHEVAVSALYYALTEGYTVYLQQLLEKMGTRSQTRHRIAAWVRHHCRCEVDGKTKYAVSAVINEDGKVSVKAGKKDLRDTIDINSANDEPYWESIDTQKTKSPWELDKALQRVLTKAIDEGITVDEVKEHVDQVAKALQEKAA